MAADDDDGDGGDDGDDGNASVCHLSGVRFFFFAAVMGRGRWAFIAIPICHLSGVRFPKRNFGCGTPVNQKTLAR